MPQCALCTAVGCGAALSLHFALSQVSLFRGHPEGPGAVSQVLDVRVGRRVRRRSSLRYSCNAGSAGPVAGTCHPTRSWGVVFGVREIWRDDPHYKMIMSFVFETISSNVL